MSRAVKLFLLATVATFALNAKAEKKLKNAKPVPVKTEQTITFENKLSPEGKKVWLPAMTTVKAGTTLKVKVINTLAEPHGFEIKKLHEPIVLGPNQSTEFTVEAKEKGTYDVSCQMHPAHVHATLKIE